MIIPAHPIPQYPPIRRDSDWATALRLSIKLLEFLRTRPAPDSDEQWQAVMHLIQTISPAYQRRLH